MAPEILLGSEISRAGATVEDLLVVDMWAYGMLLYNLLNPCLHHPCEEVLKRDASQTGATFGTCTKPAHLSSLVTDQTLEIPFSCLPPGKGRTFNIV